jgi:pimeloyl-ACP methyl ester carboxylesterase
VPLATLETGAGPAVLLVHGWGGFKEGWGVLPSALADAGFRVIVVDLPGFGASLAPAGFRHRPGDVADALAPTVRDAGPLAIVAHSMGTFPSLLLASRLPTLVSHIVLLGPAPLVATGRARRVAVLPVVGGWLAAWSIRRSNRDRGSVFRAFTSAAAHPERMSGSAAAAAAAHEATDRFIASSPVALGYSVHHALRTRSPRLAAAVTQPSLVLVGDQDRVGKPEDAAALAAAFPHGRMVVLPDCGHYPFLESPDAVRDEVVTHLRTGP